MSDREDFVAARKSRWEQLDRRLQRGDRTPEEVSEVARLYRSVAADLSRARSLDLPDDIVRYLEQLSAGAHNALYGSHRATRGLNPIQLALVDFPVELRRQWPFFVLASALFYLPFAVGAVGALMSPEFAMTVLPEATLEHMEQMYSGDSMSREAGQDAMMAGFYVMNNVGIALRCFASGVFLGLGSIYTLIYNGLMMGVIEGYLWSVGAGWNLLDFTAGHTAWELTGVVVAGTAGLKLGWSLVVTNGRTRAGSLKAAGPSLFRLIVGATVLLFGAAAIEGFWSASPVPLWGKVAFGAVQVVIIGLWLALGGIRGREA